MQGNVLAWKVAYHDIYVVLVDHPSPARELAMAVNDETVGHTSGSLRRTIVIQWFVIGSLVLYALQDALWPTGEAPPLAPDWGGAWTTSFQVDDLSLGGLFVVPPHQIAVSFTAIQDHKEITGLGEVENLLGTLSALAMVNGPQRATVSGVVGDVAIIALNIPPFGAPPASATVVIESPTPGGPALCSVNLAGSTTAPVPCNLRRVSSGAAHAP